MNEKSKDRIHNFVSTLIATFMGVAVAFLGAYWISENQKSAAIIQAQNQERAAIAQAQKQEVDSIVQLLEFAQKDVNRSVDDLNAIKQAGENQTDKEKSESVRAIDAIFAIAAPYPIAFEKILDDDRIMRRLSDGAVLGFYSAQARLDSQKTHMLDPCASADKRLASMKWYKRDLELVNALLKNEVEYQNGDIHENELLKRYGVIQNNLSKLKTAELNLLIKDEDRNSLCDIVPIN